MQGADAIVSRQEFDVGGAHPGHFQTVGVLNFAQRVTSVVQLALAQGDRPVVFGQRNDAQLVHGVQGSHGSTHMAAAVGDVQRHYVAVGSPM